MPIRSPRIIFTATVTRDHAHCSLTNQKSGFQSYITKSNERKMKNPAVYGLPQYDIMHQPGEHARYHKAMQSTLSRKQDYLSNCSSKSLQSSSVLRREQKGKTSGSLQSWQNFFQSVHVKDSGRYVKQTNCFETGNTIKKELTNRKRWHKCSPNSFPLSLHHKQCVDCS